MFGYSAMKKGLKWQFSIKIDDTVSANDIELLKTIILNSKKLGKSKSAQYGLIEISECIENVALASPIGGSRAPHPTTTLLYFKSRVALVDENGNPTYDLKYICADANIDYENCQIKTSTFTPYNGAMQTKTYERLCINKGSVIVLRDITAEQLEEIKKGVGTYLAEGFGDILVNPSFLLNRDGFSLGSEALASPKGGAKAPHPKTDLAKFLKQREDKVQDDLKILNDVDKFISDHKDSLYRKIKPSQWGNIRSICTSEADRFKDEIEEYISNGTKKWEQEQIDKLLEKCDNLEFVKLLSIQMPKGSK